MSFSFRLASVLFMSSYKPSQTDRFCRCACPAAGERHQFGVALLQAPAIARGQGLHRTADLQQAMFHRSSMMHHFERTALALGGHAFQAAAEYADAIP